MAVTGRGEGEVFGMSFDRITDLADKRNVRIYLVSVKHLL